MKKNEKPVEAKQPEPVKAEVKVVKNTDGPTAKDIIVVSRPRGISL